MDKPHYAALDGLRGVAALAVAMTHNYLILGHQPIRHGYLAVDFFYLLSGFVIADAYECRLRERLSLREFAIMRAIRLYPMIIFGALAGCLSTLLELKPPAGLLIEGTIAAGLVLPFQAWAQLGYGLWPLNPPAWSLFWEIVVNAAFAMGAFRLSTRSLLIIIALAFAALVYVALAFQSLEVGYLSSNLAGGLPRVVFSFFTGVVLNRLHHSGQLPQWRCRGWILAVGICAILGFPLVDAKGEFDLIAVTVLFPALVITGIRASATSRIWKWSGEISYPLYMIHYPVLVILAANFGDRSSDTQLAAYYLAPFVYILAASLALYFFDRPIRSTLGKVLRRKTFLR